jgi:ribosome-binding factor A
MKPFSRSDRVSGHLRRVLSEVLTRKTKDPRLKLATVTDVKMSADLKNARVYYAVEGDAKKREAAAAGFESARGFVKRTLAQHLGLRYMPEITFYYDKSLDYGARIDKLLKSIETEDGADFTTPGKKP